MSWTSHFPRQRARRFVRRGLSAGAASRSHSRAGSASNGGDLDDIFARMEPSGDLYGLGRIDDDTPPLLRTHLPSSTDASKSGQSWGWK